jgi:hypothetical protein
VSEASPPCQFIVLICTIIELRIKFGLNVAFVKLKGTKVSPTSRVRQRGGGGGTL